MFQRTRQKVFVFLPLILWFVQFVLTKLFFRKKSDVIEVEIPVGKTICRLKAFLDSGNTLYDPIFNMPVNIVSKEVTKDFEALLTPDRYLLIPYRSVGCKKGMLPAYRIPEMIVKTGVEDRHIKNVVLAITNQGIQPDDSYQMILHPAIFCKEEKR